ncbi:MAG: hypothetical protein H0T79_16575 [Deltaproteobacteria bacterium]|nr:hypothetical protein [Deltaproteobacteria bacterium]
MSPEGKAFHPWPPRDEAIDAKLSIQLIGQPEGVAMVSLVDALERTFDQMPEGEQERWIQFWSVLRLPGAAFTLQGGDLKALLRSCGSGLDPGWRAIIDLGDWADDLQVTIRRT